MTMVANSLRDYLYREGDVQQKRKPVLDCAGDDCDIMDSASNFEAASIRMDVAAAIKQWAEDTDLEDGEGISDRLQALIVGIADSNQDGELDDDEQELIAFALEAAWDYLLAIGVDESDLDLLLNEWDASAAERIRDLVIASEGDDTDLDNFAFADGDQDTVFDATYRKKIAIRGGKKVRINKRISGTVHLSGKQKLAIRKMGLKSRSASAKVHRLKSMHMRKKMGL